MCYLSPKQMTDVMISHKEKKARPAARTDFRKNIIF